MRYAAGTFPSSAAVGTINGDTARDLVVPDLGTNVFSYLAGNGTGTFPTVTSSAPVGTSPRKPILKDLDGDGDLDLVVINSSSSSASVFLGNNAGGFAPVGTCSGGPTPGAYCTAAADCGTGGTCPAKEFFAGVEPWRGFLADVNQDG